MTDTRATDETRQLLDLASSGLRIYDLARPYTIGMPQSPNHPAYWRTMPRRHGDVVRSDGGSAANDLIVMGTHVGTHMDALAHVSHNGRLHGDLDAAYEQAGGGFTKGGIDQVPPLFGRGVLLDVPAARGESVCDSAYEITPGDLEAAVIRQGTPIDEGDVVLVRSGWGRHWGDRERYIGKENGVPGVGPDGARWLAERGIRAAGADTIAFEQLAAGSGHTVLPVHRIMLVEQGINLIETMALEELAADEVHEFLLALAPLPFVGATGSPVRPLAIVVDDA